MAYKHKEGGNKNSLDAVNIRLDIKEDRHSELAKRTIEFTEIKGKYNNIKIIEPLFILSRYQKENRMSMGDRLFEEIKAENFPNLAVHKFIDPGC